MLKAPTLTKAQLQDLKQLLEQRHALLERQQELELVNLVKTAKDGIDEEQKEFSAPESNASAEQELAERHTHEMQGIEQALQRVSEGHYGICMDCQSNIDFPRLLASPSALRCLTCQEAYELAGKRFRT
jgi:DnaK suppressor protein